MKSETKQLDNIFEAIDVGIYMFSLQSLGSSLVTKAAVSLHFPLPNIKF